MDAQKSKPIFIGVAVVCLLAAGIMLYRNFSGGPRIDRSVVEAPVAVYCYNCKAGFEMSFDEYGDLINAEAGPRFTCPKCSQKALVSGFKCVKCGTLFPIDYDRNPMMKCPKCGTENPEE